MIYQELPFYLLEIWIGYISVAIKASFLKLGMCNMCKNNITKMFLGSFTSLAKEVTFLVASVCLSVCLSVDITQTVMDGLG